jgi:hypothetical protein
MYDKLIYPELSYKINGILFSVHNEEGRYCNEKQYSDAIEQKLKKLNIIYEREKNLPKSFDGELVGRNKGKARYIPSGILSSQALFKGI